MGEQTAVQVLARRVAAKRRERVRGWINSLDPMIRHQVGLTYDELARYQARLAKVVGPALGIADPPHLPAVIHHARGLTQRHPLPGVCHPGGGPVAVHLAHGRPYLRQEGEPGEEPPPFDPGEVAAAGRALAVLRRLEPRRRK